MKHRGWWLPGLLLCMAMGRCGGTSTPSAGGTSTGSITSVNDGVTLVENIAAYRDQSQCQMLDGGGTAKGLAPSHPVPKGISIDPSQFSTQDLQDLKTQFGTQLASLQRTITDKTQSVQIDALLQQAIQQGRQWLANAQAQYLALAANQPSPAYPTTNFSSETAPNHEVTPNQDFFDRLEVRRDTPRADGRTSFRISSTTPEGVARSDIAPEDVLVEGLDAEGNKVHDFTQFEWSNVLAEVSLAREALTIVTVNDYSGSMASDLDHVEAALKAFYSVYPDDLMSEIVKFTEETMIYYPLGPAGGNSFEAAITRRPRLGATAIYDAVTTGITDVCQGKGLRALLLLTDGQDNSSRTSLDDTIRFAQRNHIPIFIIGFGYANKAVLARLASETGGAYLYFPYAIYQSLGNNPFDTAYQLFANLLNYSYLITVDTIPASVKTIQVQLKIGGMLTITRLAL